MTRVLAMFGLLLLPSCKTPATVETREPAEPRSAAVVVVEAQPAETKVVHPPRLEGTYAIERIEYVDGASERPGEHLETDPGYVFGREALVFGATTVRQRYEVATAPKGDASASLSRVCMVEVQTTLRWFADGFEVEVAATGHAVARTIERTESAGDAPDALNYHWSTNEVTCSTHLTDGEYRLAEVSSDLQLGRPGAVTIVREDGAIYYLVAADDEPDLKPVLNNHFGRQ